MPLASRGSNIEGRKIAKTRKFLNKKPKIVPLDFNRAILNLRTQADGGHQHITDKQNKLE